MSETVKRAEIGDIKESTKTSFLLSKGHASTILLEEMQGSSIK